MVYALGNGMGHLTRALALARAANRVGVDVRIATNSPYAESLIPLTTDWVDSAKTHFDVISSGDDVTRCRSRIQDWLTLKRDLLFVDTFPRGLAGELAELRKCGRLKCLVLRDLNPAYVQSYQLDPWVNCYDRIFAAGEASVLGPTVAVTPTAPWLVCRADELLPVDQARRALGVEANDTRPVVLVVGCGRSEELAEMRQFAERLEVRLGNAVIRFASVHADASSQRAGATHICRWPLFAIHQGIDLLVGGGGYNTVNEARASNTPLLAIPRARMYDRQAIRLSAREKVTSLEALEERVRGWIGEYEGGRVLRKPHSDRIAFENGVAQAVEEAIRLCKSV